FSAVLLTPFSTRLLLFSTPPPPPLSTLFPYTTLFRSVRLDGPDLAGLEMNDVPGSRGDRRRKRVGKDVAPSAAGRHDDRAPQDVDRKSTRLNSSHVSISYAVFCLKKKKQTTKETSTNT